MRSGFPCLSALRTSSVVAAWRSSTTTTCCATTSGAPTQVSPQHPVLVDRFLDDAVEIDVDALYDGEELFLAGVMEHIEEAGIHSGDSACALPPMTLGRTDIERIRSATEAIAEGSRGAWTTQCPVRAGVGCALRTGGESPGVTNRALRV